VQNLMYSRTWNWQLIACDTNWCVRNPPEGVSVIDPRLIQTSVDLPEIFHINGSHLVLNSLSTKSNAFYW
jgi:hypothetical protein